MVERQEPWRVAEYLQAMVGLINAPGGSGTLNYTMPMLVQIDEMIAEVDKNGSGTIDFDDFLYMMTDKIEERDSEEDLKKAFHIIDHDNDGRISVEDIMTISKELGESFTHEEIIEMIKVADHTVPFVYYILPRLRLSRYSCDICDKGITVPGVPKKRSSLRLSLFSLFVVLVYYHDFIFAAKILSLTVISVQWNSPPNHPLPFYPV
ncbi:Calcium-binding protein CML19 [Platanthera zijinensis]|uniref:Calcium-binding protein CML19 n=1 Tax=Platanthera zijinensis TaxID=2320716 RepID=A0AAP0B6V9_9ASPA